MSNWQGNLGNMVEPGQELRASLILTAAFVTDGPIFCSGFTEGIVTFTYTRGAANGAFDWYMEGSIYGVDANAPAGANVWGQENLVALGVLAGGATTINLLQTEYQTYQEEGSGVAESFGFDFGFTGNDRLRLYARESGVVGTPGILQVQIGMR